MAASTAHRKNLFDVLRLVAAATVLFTHSWTLTGRGDPLFGVWHNQTGTLGVLVFFGISGFLIAGSWVTEPRVRAFALKRALRVLPGLIVCAVVTAFVIGPLVTADPLGSYFADPSVYLYVVRQLALITFNPFLPGVFETNPYPDVVNGSLWTLPLEACCYMAVAVAGVIGVLHRRWLLIGLLAVVVIAVAIGRPPDDPLGEVHTLSDTLVNALRACGAFLCGTVLWFSRERLPRNPWPLAVVAMGIVVLPLPEGVHSAVAMLVIPLAAICVGLHPPGRAGFILKPGDVSYGVYIYSYPVQQTLVYLLPAISPVALLLLTAPAAYVLRLLSWRLVERPANRFGRRVLRRPAGLGEVLLATSDARA
jgi:peptidoglycan/LPS O-acetylase OafA/YrhL